MSHFCIFMLYGSQGLNFHREMIPAKHTVRCKTYTKCKTFVSTGSLGLFTSVDKKTKGVIILTGIIGAYYHKDLVLLLCTRTRVWFSESFGVPMTSFVSDVVYFHSRISILKS